MTRKEQKIRRIIHPSFQPRAGGRTLEKEYTHTCRLVAYGYLTGGKVSTHTSHCVVAMCVDIVAALVTRLCNCAYSPCLHWFYCRFAKKNRLLPPGKGRREKKPFRTNASLSPSSLSSLSLSLSLSLGGDQTDAYKPI